VGTFSDLLTFAKSAENPMTRTKSGTDSLDPLLCQLIWNSVMSPLDSKDKDKAYRDQYNGHEANCFRLTGGSAGTKLIFWWQNVGWPFVGSNSQHRQIRLHALTISLSPAAQRRKTPWYVPITACTNVERHQLWLINIDDFPLQAPGWYRVCQFDPNCSDTTLPPYRLVFNISDYNQN